MTVIADYEKRTARSREHFVAAGAMIPAGATRSLNSWPPHPVYLESGAGMLVTDVDGNTYRDFLANYTALPLGYADQDVTRALAEQLTSGTAHSFSRTQEKALAELIVARVPSIERIRFTGSGTESVMFALRLAKAFTGRPAVAKAEGGYHGTTDEVMISVRPPADKAGAAHAPNSVAEMAGIPESRLHDTIVLPFNDIDASTAVLRANADRLAALVLEPVLGVGGMIPADRAYLAAMRAVCDELGIVLVFDEVITLRLAPGGGQEHYGVTPDLTTMGKIVGGGLPIGAYGGRADIMSLLEPRGGTDVYDARSGGPALYQGGTFTGNALSLAAGLTTMRKLDAAAIADLNAHGELLRTRVAKAASGSLVPLTVTGVGSLFNLHVGVTDVRVFRDVRGVDAAKQHRLFLALLNRGAIIAPRGMGCVSTCTTETDIDFFAAAVAESLDAITAED
ncbi:aspartate aminotransferase family protein [Actinokineospora enzanensis]|uniref:aspartate aminotransferase family protein n=1 Tax=Actinokineospora enzanensis TaxID=155975 RepID=UPI00037E7235|nr:aspartate aminotransferase family protein [Actinokineospora enzanensis]